MTTQRAVALGVLRDPRARFLVVGLASTAVHLAVLSLAVHLVVAEAANAVAFGVSVQANFAASYWWTWSSRRAPGRESAGRLVRAWALFHGSALVAFGVNSACFSAAHRLLDAPPLVSALLATAVSCLVSFAVSSRLVFARREVLVLPEAALVSFAGPAAALAPAAVLAPVAGAALAVAPVVPVLAVVLPAQRTPAGREASAVPVLAVL
ncbi:GtrA family protein [Quadrisphaera sp. INWT6]|uniref:GtrA family protein n=1 Tax=Quadrisphaera sp. INWT6 TaxID=2596917 RepID=UPI0018923E08|nr:GtrA family protein [Quadrisphaera sp. INWT6]MBF5080296.1 GtrA family protein [Quadrisphaera sp. INWT6]